LHNSTQPLRLTRGSRQHFPACRVPHRRKEPWFRRKSVRHSLGRSTLGSSGRARFTDDLQESLSDFAAPFKFIVCLGDKSAANSQGVDPEGNKIARIFHV